MATLTIDSPFGPLRLTSAGSALTALDWGAAVEESPDAVLPDTVLDEAARQLAGYFAGRRRVFDLPLAPAGTPFQQRVWTLMSAIPYGETWTYGAMARRLGSAARAVGGACGRNPLPIIIPCHRVVGGQGRAGGYSGQGGLATKAWLLDHECGHAPAAGPVQTALDFARSS